jgi:hypothetical protein
MPLLPLTRLLAVVLGAAACVAVHAQSVDRAARIDEIVAAAAHAGFPHLLGDALPMTLRYGVHEELLRLGQARQLGADWKPGNPWYQRASDEADRATAELAQQVSAQPPDWEAPLRDALDSVQDAELDGLTQLYRSPAAPLMQELADAGTSLFILASLETQRKSLGLRARAMPVMQRLSERIGKLGEALDADQRAAITQQAPKQALKTMAVVHEEFFHNTMRGLQTDLEDTRLRLRRQLGPLLEQYDPLQPVPPAGQ